MLPEGGETIAVPLHPLNPNSGSGLPTSKKSLNDRAQREMRVKYRLGVVNKNLPSELRYSVIIQAFQSLKIGDEERKKKT